ncbi:MAG: glycoside hydrolase family 66 protein [Acidimicrobiales bacterium]
MGHQRFFLSKKIIASLVGTLVLIAGTLTAGAVVTTTPPTKASTQPVQAHTTTTLPSTTSAASLYLSNWQNMQAIWMAPKLNQQATATYGPRIAELHYSGNWGVNQIVDYTGFFRDQTDGVKYDQPQNFTTTGYLDQNGVLNGTYGTYNGATTPIQMQRDFVMVPNEPFMVVRYTLTNPSSTTSYNWSVLDQVHLNNTNSADNVVGSYDSTRNAMFADMTASGQYVVFLGAMQSPTSYQVGNDSNCTATDATASAWCQFDANNTLSNNSSLSTPNMDLGFQNSVTIAPNSSQTLYYYLGIQSTMSAAQTAPDTARAQTGAYWYSQTATDYANWLNAGKTISTSDTGVNTAYLRNLVVIKNSQNPTTGLFPAATNPGSYGYKAWVRDSSFDAMALDAAGHYSSAAKYWEWMAANQLSNGTWYTTYDLWSGSYISFVQPEYDSVGEFLVGVYRHYQLTGDSTFLSTVWPAVQAAANFIQSNIGTNGLGAQDYSIWEQTLQYNTFTEAFYVAGLRAAAHLALSEADPSAADSWNGAASTILSAVQRSYSWSSPGQYNDTTGYYNQGVTSTGSPDTTIDSSSDELIALGDVNANTERAASQISVVEQALTHDTWGIARYTGDTYYYTSPYSPAGNEAGSAEPMWPNMTMLVALYEVYTGQMSNALSRLQWYASVSGVGYMPPGEAVSWQTDQPIVSTMSEPFTAAAFIMTSLAYTGQYDPRVYPTNANASAYATINETTTPATDWPQWRSIPFYDGNPAANTSGSTMSSISRVYASNDANNLYLRVDNAAGSLSAYNTSPYFAVLVYAQDFNHSTSIPATSTGFYGGTLDHPMNYLFARWSNSTTYSMFSANSSGGWTFDTNLSTLAPQWDPSTGRIELEIPLTDMASSGSAGAGSWSYIDTEIAYNNPSTGAWSDADIMGLHYEIASAGQAWLYGNTLGHEIESLTTNASRYSPNTGVTINANIVNPQAVAEAGQTLTLSFTHNGVAVGSPLTTAVSLAAGQVQNYALTWSPPTTDYQGYLVQATLTDASGNVLDTAYTAVDVSSSWTKFPRYGFVTNFGDNYLQTLITNNLNLYHLDGVQFYDWEWKQHVPLAGTVTAPATSWVNIDNNTNYQHSIETLISDVQNNGAMAMNYNLIYGAWAGYGTDGSGVNYQWGLWDSSNCTNQANVALPDPPLATPNIYLFDPGNTSWQNYIYTREQNVNAVYPFNGWQADSYGSIGTVYTCGGTSVNIASELNGFLTNAYGALGGNLVFNAVGQYGQQQIAANPDLAFLYTECWPTLGQTTYNDLQTVINNNNTWSSGTKSTVLAAYPDQAYGNTFSSTDPGFFSTPGVLYEDATIFASGGDHIELGDVNHMLDAPNYLNENLFMPAVLQRAMVNYYNFLTAYENLLRSGLTASNNAIDLTGGLATSTNATPGTVWTFARSKTGTDVLQFINMLNLSSADWMDTNATQPAPTVQTNVAVKYYYTSSTAPVSVYVASPDVNGGVAQSLSFTTGSDSGGNYVTFTLPSLDYWDMAWVNY